MKYLDPAISVAFGVTGVVFAFDGAIVECLACICLSKVYSNAYRLECIEDLMKK